MSTISCDELFKELGQFAEADPTHWSTVGGSFIWRVEEEGKNCSWLHQFTPHVELRKLRAGEHVVADCSIATSIGVLFGLASGQRSLQESFLSSEFRIAGDVRAAFRLQHMFELWRESRTKALGNTKNEVFV